MRHKDLTSDEAIHQAAYIQAADPGAVGAWKIWVDITSAAAPVFKYRNAGDAAWVVFNPVPALHAASHQTGGGDAIKLDDLAAPDDNTDLDADTTKHGLMKKFPGGTTDFLRADGSFAAPSGGGGGGSVTSVTIDDIPGSPHADDEEFATTDGFAWLNQGSSTVSYTRHTMLLGCAAGSGVLRGRLKSITSPSGNYKYQAKIHGCSLTGTGDMDVGLFLRESGTSKIQAFSLCANRTGGQTCLRVTGWADENSIITEDAFVLLGAVGLYCQPWVLEVERSGSNLVYSFMGPMGGTPKILLSTTVSTKFTTEPNQIGFFIRPTGGEASHMVAAWLRRV